MGWREELRSEALSNRVLEAMGRVPREEFVPEDVRDMAEANRPLPIGEGQTISQPYIVARMTDLAELEPHHRVLEIGTGSGYQAAVLAELASEVHTVEVIQSLAQRARQTLEWLGYGGRIRFRVGDGYSGWPEHGPYDAILVTAAPEEVPQALLDQLALGGRLVIPVGSDQQHLLRIRRTEEGGFESESVVPVMFVPMVHPAPAANAH